MTSWFEKGRPALQAALAQICDQIDADITADLESSEVHQLAECKALLTQKNTKIESLEKENAKLHAHIKQFRHNPSDKFALEPLPNSSSPMPNGLLESSDPETAQKIEYAKLAQRFRLLNDNFRKARGALERRKAERDAWKKRFETLQDQMHTAESEYGIEISSRASAALVALQPVATSFGSSFSSACDPDEAVPTPEEPQLPPIVPGSSDPSRPAGGILGPLDSTQGESEANDLPSLPATAEAPSDPSVKNEPSSDCPVMVSERPAKRRKGPDGKTDTPTLARIKPDPEDHDSPLAIEAAMAASQESVDLGHITHMTTPRKPRDTEQTPKVSALYRIPAADASTSVTPVARYARHDMAAPQTARASIMSSALTPINVNRRMIRSGGDKPDNMSRKRRRELDQKIADLGEDEGHFSHGQENTPLRNAQNRHQTPKNRLEQLLHTGEAENSPALSRPSRQSRKEQSISTAELNIPQRRELPFDKQARQSRPILQPPATAQPGPRSPQRSPQRSAKHGQIRQKPPRELRLEDFRINPAANQGHDFAYSDVIRDKDERACLPGCVEMHCCGKDFRALALSHRPNPPLTPAQRMEEQTLLEQHLGDYAYRLATMDPLERAEAWIQAKTQELANKYGRHRHRYSRMQSPPGFWDADFPSTQELKQNREEAAEREKRAIRERYREAMKPGGRWLFKDE